MKNTAAGNVVKGAVAGLIGGLTASFVMGKFQAFLEKLAEEQQSNSKKKKAEPANVKAAEAISEKVFEHRLKKSEKEPAGEAVHYAMGATSGLLYGITAELAPVLTKGYGLPFGATVWLVADDLVVPALGLSKPPAQFPLSTNIYALSSHLVYGLTTELVRRGIKDLMS